MDLVLVMVTSLCVSAVYRTSVSVWRSNVTSAGLKQTTTSLHLRTKRHTTQLHRRCVWVCDVIFHTSVTKCETRSDSARLASQSSWIYYFFLITIFQCFFFNGGRNAFLGIDKLFKNCCITKEMKDRRKKTHLLLWTRRADLLHGSPRYKYQMTILYNTMRCCRWTIKRLRGVQP